MNNDLKSHAVKNKLVKNSLNPLFGIELDLPLQIPCACVN